MAGAGEALRFLATPSRCFDKLSTNGLSPPGELGMTVGPAGVLVSDGQPKVMRRRDVRGRDAGGRLAAGVRAIACLSTVHCPGGAKPEPAFCLLQSRHHRSLSSP